MNELYARWNDALVDEYFAPGKHQGEVACLPVDDDELKSLAERAGICPADQATASLVSATQAFLLSRGGDWSALSKLTGWRNVRNHPPYVAALAVAVLAAMRMGSDEKVSSGNYYAQLNLLMGNPADSGQPPGYQALPSAWKDLKKWLDDDCGGDRGISTIPDKPRQTYIGYALSQALLRAADRRRLPDFFVAVGLEPQAEISPDELFAVLKTWAARPGAGLTPRGRHMIAAAVDTEQYEIGETVLRELRAWDGQLRDDRGRVRMALELRIVPGRRHAYVELVAPRNRDWPTTGWRCAQMGTFHELLPHKNSQDWWSVGYDVSNRVLRDGLKLANGGYALVFDSGQAIAAAQAPVELSGGYITVPQARMFEPQIAVVADGQRDALLKYLEPHTQHRPQIATRSPLPAGWSLTSAFQFQRPPSLVPEPFERIAPRLLAFTSLQGGLPLGRAIYLSGGEPDVSVAAQAGQQPRVSIDGRQIAMPRGESQVVALSEQSLEPGEHVLEVDLRRRFTTAWSRGETEPSDAGRLAHLLTSSKRGYRSRTDGPADRPETLPPGQIAIAGAKVTGRQEDLPRDPETPVLLPTGRNGYWLLGAQDSECVFYEPQEAPQWLRRAGLAKQFQFVEFTVRFEPVWALLLKADRTIQVQYVGPHGTRIPAPQTNGADTAWREVVRRAGNARLDDDALSDQWSTYLAAAGAEA